MSQGAKVSIALGMMGFGALTFGLSTVHALWYAPEAQVLPDTSAHSIAEPARILIPVLAVDAPIERLGIKSPHIIASPAKFSDAGWYTYGPTPGEEGSAVITGHLNNGLGLSGVFINLNKVRAGDSVWIITKTGETLQFKVDRLQTYDYTAIPDAVFTKEGGRYLNLITCDGTWLKDPVEGWTYNKRLVVYTHLVHT